jgi:hypothetical protein
MSRLQEKLVRFALVPILEIFTGSEHMQLNEEETADCDSGLLSKIHAKFAPS